MSDTLALVLSGGGARGAYQVGVISWLAEQYPDLEIKIITGVSAGAINAIVLAANESGFGAGAHQLRSEWEQLFPESVYCVRSGRVVAAALRTLAHFIAGTRSGTPAVRGWLDMSALGGVLSRCVDFAGIRSNIAAGRLRAVALTATSYDTGHTVTFIQGDDDLTGWHRARRVGRASQLSLNHVLASAAIPLVFKAIEIEGEYYGDGSLRQTAPLAPAVHLGAGKILAISMRSSVGAVESTDCYPSAAQIGGLMFNSLFLDALDADAEQLQRMNRLLEGLPDSADHAGLRPVGLQLIRPSRDLGNLAHGVRVDLDPLLSFALRGIGGNRDRASDLRSYLMFHPAYTNILMELGYDDARAQEDEIRGFIES